MSAGGQQAAGSAGPSSVTSATATAVTSAVGGGGGAVDVNSQMTTYRSYVALLADPNAKDENKLKAAQEINENFEFIMNSASFPQFLDLFIKTCLRLLQDGTPCFLAEYPVQQLRKLVLEILHRTPAVDALRPYTRSVVSAMFRLLECDNEDNVLVCLRVIIEMHKQFRPPHTPEIQQFLAFVKSIYQELPNHLSNIFERPQTVTVGDLTSASLTSLLAETYTVTSLRTDKKNADGASITYNLLPKAVLSLKVLAELPIIVVLMYQLYKQNVHQDVAEFIPLIMSTITLQPSQQVRASVGFNREILVDFMAAQIKTLSFLAYIIKIYQDQVELYSSSLVRGVLGLLILCPPQVAHLRKEILIAARYILQTDLRLKFVPYMNKLFDENILLGSGWTANEACRTLAYSTLADLVHHVRQQLTLPQLATAVHLFAKNIHDESQPTTIQTMSCKLLLNLVDSIRSRSEVEPHVRRAMLMRMLDLFVHKFKTIAQTQIPALRARSEEINAASSVNAATATTIDANSAATSAGTGGGVSESCVDVTSAPAATAQPASASALLAHLDSISERQHAVSSSLSSACVGAGSVSSSRATVGGAGGTATATQGSSRLQYTVTDCRNLVKTLICGVKTITWGCALCKSSPSSSTAAGGASDGGSGGSSATAALKLQQSEQFSAAETVIFIRLVHWALLALDVYTLQQQPAGGGGGGGAASGGAAVAPAVVSTRQQMQPTVRTREEKEVLEHFAGVFAMMHPATFHEIFSVTIDYMVERINGNSALQVVANSFLANAPTSPIFATILVEYLLERMHVMGSNQEKSALYLKLFKLIFGSVTILPNDNEQMLKPYLHKIVNKSMDLAMTAKEPYNYFLLLRALFRSIGGGSHDLLYQEFLPLLPSLLQGLNSLQSALHKQYMRDLFVELCLTVPVRLSSLLPYLPMLMDPLVSALNGSQTLVSQGLRTLELCVDNLQPDFLYEHIQPVRAELMQALWRTIHNPADQVAHNAFRVLGKFGGGNRRMMVEPQALQYCDAHEAAPAAAPCVTVLFHETRQPVALPVDMAIETAYNTLKGVGGGGVNGGGVAVDLHSRQQAWQLVRSFLLSSMSLDDDYTNMHQLLAHPSFRTGDIMASHTSLSKLCDARCRGVLQTALSALFTAAANKQLSPSASGTMVAVVTHYTLLACVQQAGPFMSQQRACRLNQQNMDPLVMVDALATVMAVDDKQLCVPARLAINTVLNTASTVLGSLDRACQLPLLEYMCDRLCGLCYERPWYSKLGGCEAIVALTGAASTRWTLEHQYSCVRALMFVITDMSGEVSNGAVERAKRDMEHLLTSCAAPSFSDLSVGDTQPPTPVTTANTSNTGGGGGADLAALRTKSLHDVTNELVRQITSPNGAARKQAMHCLESLARVTGRSVSALIQPHKDTLADMVPPKKHLVRHQPANAQIGIMDGNTFCLALQPRLFTIDLSISEHKVFFSELFSLCEADDASLLKLSCYKATNLVPIRQSALRCLAQCHHVASCRDNVFSVLYNRALQSPNTELQQCGFECMQHFVASAQLDMEMVHKEMRPLLLLLGDHRSLTLSVVARLGYLTRLFPNTFKERLCEQLVQHLRRWMDAAIQSRAASGGTLAVVDTGTGGDKVAATGRATNTTTASSSSSTSSTVSTSNMQEICTAILSIFCHIPAASSRFVEVLIRLVLNTESQLCVGTGSTMCAALLKFLARYPKETLQYLMTESVFKIPANTRFLHYLLDHEEGGVFRLAAQDTTDILANLIVGEVVTTVEEERAELRFQAVRACFLLARHNADWISTQHLLVNALRQVWCRDDYHVRHQAGDPPEGSHWHEPRLLGHLLLRYFVRHPHETDLLLQLVRALAGRYIVDFQFIKDFLETTVAQTYSVSWKRDAFFKFVQLYQNPAIGQMLKARVLQHVIMPCFAVSFERGESDALVGCAPAPDDDSPHNIVSVFIRCFIDADRQPPPTPTPAAPSTVAPGTRLSTASSTPVKATTTAAGSCDDGVRILLLQFSCLLIEHASPHIHDVSNKRQGNKLRRLMTFAWPCLMSRNCVDPTTKYHGHLLLSHIIAKFAIHKRIVLQVFHSLLKAHAMEARASVRQALDILTPAMPMRMEDGNTMLTHWTKKIIVEEGHHSLTQLMHMLQLLVRHNKVYYPVRHQLMVHMISSVQRLAFSNTGTPEHRRLAVDLAEVIIRWEITRMQDEESFTADNVLTPGVSRESLRRIDKIHAETLVNFLLKLACQVSELVSGAVTAGSGNSPGELLSRRCVALLRLALQPGLLPPGGELRLTWADKLLLSVESSQPNYTNICTALELLCYLLHVLRREQVLVNFKHLQRGLTACMMSSNQKVVRCVHTLLTRLTAMFPTEPTGSPVSSKYDELDPLYSSIGKVCSEGLVAYEKNMSAAASSLYGTLMVLKAVCSTSQCYVDRLITSFMRVLQRLAREHLTPGTEATPVAVELLIVALDLVKNRVGVMGLDMRKSFIGAILVNLIEKTSEVQVVQAIIKMVGDWVRDKSPVALNQGPSLREKSILLVKLMHSVEKRFGQDTESGVLARFLDLVLFVYRDDQLKSTELTVKLEPAFLSGLRCTQADVRARFFTVFDQSMKRRIYERLLYIICSQNWEYIGQHYWIRQCVELVLVTANDTQLQVTCGASGGGVLLPSVCSVIQSADVADRQAYLQYQSKAPGGADVVMPPSSSSSPSFCHLTDSSPMDIDCDTTMDMDVDGQSAALNSGSSQPLSLDVLISRQCKLIEAAREVRTSHFLSPLSQLSHHVPALAERVWLDFFPRIWKTLSERQQQSLSREMVPFIVSGAHNIQKDCGRSALNTFVEAVMHCQPAINIRSCIVRYLGKSHNLWHRMTLWLEQAALDGGVLSLLSAPSGGHLQRHINTVGSFSATAAAAAAANSADMYEFEPNCSVKEEHSELLENLCDMYQLLHEEDFWVGLWQRMAKYPETVQALAYEQHGFFEKAQATYELATTRVRADYSTTPAPVSLQQEMLLLERRWLRCCKELNQWDTLLEYGRTPTSNDHLLVMESAWRVPNWPVMKDALQQVELNCPKEMAWKVNLYRGYISICHPDDSHLSSIEKLVDQATSQCIREWRRLPAIVSHIHVSFLQAAQQIMELQEAAQIHQNVLHGRSSAIHDMKAIVKTWRNRLPVIGDDLRHWSDVFTWRQHHYQFVVSHYSDHQLTATNQSMLGVHASAQAIIHFGKVARKHGLTSVCLDNLNRIHTIPSVPIVDCFQKIRQQIKCYHQSATCILAASSSSSSCSTATARPPSLSDSPDLHEGLEVIENTNMKFFSKEMVSEFYALKGLFLSLVSRSDEANKAFSASLQMDDSLSKAWALWGEYLEASCTRSCQVDLQQAASCIICFLHASRHQKEHKSRKYLSKVLWLLSYNDESNCLAETVENYCAGVPVIHWLAWVPQLLTCLVRNEGRCIMNLLTQVGRTFPQAVYFPIRALYLTLKIEQLERHKTAAHTFTNTNTSSSTRNKDPPATGSTTSSTTSTTTTTTSSAGAAGEAATTATSGGSSAGTGTGGGAGDGSSIRATAPMWRCSRIMHTQRDVHPTVLCSLEGIVDQLVWFRENWYEEVLRQLRQALTKCLGVAFESRQAVTDATITPHTLNFVRKLVATFGIGVENVSSSVSPGRVVAASEFARRVHATVQDPVFQRMKVQFTSDFEFAQPGSVRLHSLIQKLKKWIKILEVKIRHLPKRFLIEEKCRWLSNFSCQTADVELPGEFLQLKHSHYCVRIARFTPRVEIVQKHGTAARRLFIRGNNGKLYPYLVVNDTGLSDGRREERLLQLLRMINHCLTKNKETSRRFLSYTVPRVVAVSPHMRLVEDNPASLSLLDIYRQRCAQRGLEHDAPISRYYDRLASIQSQGGVMTHRVLRDNLREVQMTMVPRTLLHDWAVLTYPNATSYWMFRKTLTLQIALLSLAEHVLCLSRLAPDMMHVHQDSGLVSVAYFKFDLDDSTGELGSERPVPFRLTANLCELVTELALQGPLPACMISAARCLIQPNHKLTSMLRVILRDEVIGWYRKKQDEPGTSTTGSTGTSGDIASGQLVQLVCSAVDTISDRLAALTPLNPSDNKTTNLIQAATNIDNLCRMNPVWHPWL